MNDIIKLYRNTLKNLKKQKGKIDRTISYLEKTLGELEQLEMTSTAKKSRKHGRVTLADMAVQILEQLNKAMSTKELVEAIRERGHTVSSTSSLYPSLQREKRIVKVNAGTWALAERLTSEDQRGGGSENDDSEAAQY